MSLLKWNNTVDVERTVIRQRLIEREEEEGEGESEGCASVGDVLFVHVFGRDTCKSRLR
jgi:hypothetical protein